MIYTSNFAHYSKLFPNQCPIAICLYPPENWNGKVYFDLAPDETLLWEFKECGDENHFRDVYFGDVLFYLNPHNVQKDLFQLSEGKIPVLMCYEKSTDFCHRHLVREWFNSAGIECQEL